MLPLAAHALLQSVELLAAGSRNLADIDSVIDIVIVIDYRLIDRLTAIHNWQPTSLSMPAWSCWLQAAAIWRSGRNLHCRPPSNPQISSNLTPAAGCRQPQSGAALRGGTGGHQRWARPGSRKPASSSSKQAALAAYFLLFRGSIIGSDHIIINNIMINPI